MKNLTVNKFYVVSKLLREKVTFKFYKISYNQTTFTQSFACARTSGLNVKQKNG